MLSNLSRLHVQYFTGVICRTGRLSASRSLLSRAFAIPKPAHSAPKCIARFSTSRPSLQSTSDAASSRNARMLFVANLPQYYRSEHLKDEIEKLGVTVEQTHMRKGVSWGHVEFASEKDAQIVLEACGARPVTLGKKELRFNPAGMTSRTIEPSQWIVVRGLPEGITTQAVADLFGAGAEKVDFLNADSALVDMDSIDNAKPVVEGALAKPKRIGNRLVDVVYAKRTPPSPTNELHFAMPFPGVGVADLRKAFSEFKSSITDIRTIAPTKGFITFNSTDAAVLARSKMNGEKLAGSKIILTFPYTKRDSSRRPVG